MLLRTLSIRRLHEALTLDISFNEDITLLVGINGSGKTSVLNVIDWLLKPDLRRLALAEYESLSLRFSHNDQEYEVSSNKTLTKVIYAVTGVGEELPPITIDIVKSAEIDDERSEELYGGLTLEKHEIPMWELIKSFSKPTVISLDRTISAESEEVQYIETPRGGVQRRVRTQSPLGYVREVTSAKYAEYRTKAIANDDELKAQILMSALQSPELPKGRSVKIMNKNELAHLEQKVTSYLSGVTKSADVAAQVRSFFSSSKLLAEGFLNQKDQFFLLNFVNSQYRQIENLAKAFNDFEKKNATSFANLNEYLSAINRFFSDSNKELFFDESTGKLVFSFIDKNQKRGAKKAIAHLSSGERQILILFTFLSFASHSQGVFIVDEPELSLHPKWQHEFMEVFLRLRPPDTQLLLATHSPDIVGKYKKSCVTLRSVNEFI